MVARVAQRAALLAVTSCKLLQRIEHAFRGLGQLAELLSWSSRLTLKVSQRLDVLGAHTVMLTALHKKQESPWYPMVLRAMRGAHRTYRLYLGH